MITPLTQEDIQKLLTTTTLLFNHIHWVEHAFNVQPTNKKHRKTSINFNDIKERRADFLKELINTVTSWVYSKPKIQEIFSERLRSASGDYGNASTFLTTQAFSKFRPDEPQGQFGELLLFNFIQHFFKAAPLLRKQPITTSIGHERFGGDAFHYKREQDKNILILGESKCYKSKYSFRTAFENSLNSISSTFNNMDRELGLYVYDDFIEQPLLDVAKAFKDGTLPNVHFELVCLIAYHENGKLTGKDEQSIKKEILTLVENQCSKIKSTLYDGIEKNVLDKIHYIFFPIFKLDTLLDEFSIIVGSKHD